MKKIISFVVIIGLMFSLIPFGYINSAKAEDLEVIWVEGYDYIGDFSDGMAVVAVEDEKGNSKCGAVDKTGKWVIPAEFNYIEDFENGMSWAKKGDVMGYIDKTGRFIKQYSYYVNGFIDGVSVAIRPKSPFPSKSYGLVDEKGTFILPMKYDFIEGLSDGLILVRPDFFKDNWIYVDKTGKKVLEVKATVCGVFKEGLACIGQGKKQGYMDKTGKVVIPIIYDYVSEFEDGLAEVRRGDKCGYIDKNGNEVVPVKYDDLGEFKEGLAVYSIYVKNEFYSEKCGYVDRNGNEVLRIDYDGARDFCDGLARVEVATIGEDGDKIYKTGYIDKTGALAIPAVYDDGMSFSEGVAVVFMHDGPDEESDLKEGLIDKTGKMIVPPVYDKIWDSKEGMLIVEKEGRIGFIKNPLMP